MSLLDLLLRRPSRQEEGRQLPSTLVVLTDDPDALHCLHVIELHGQARRLRSRMDVRGWTVRVDPRGGVVSERKQ